MRVELKPEYLNLQSEIETLKYAIVWPCGQEHTWDVHVCQYEHHPGDVSVLWVWRSDDR